MATRDVPRLSDRWLYIADCDLRTELRQCREEGRAVSPSWVRAANRLTALDADALREPANQAKAGALLDESQRFPIRRDFPFDEPSDLPGIRRLRSRGPRNFAAAMRGRELRDRFLGAWLGRVAGCLLGKPIEGVKTDVLWPFLRATGQWPLRTYIRFGVRGKPRKDFGNLLAPWRIQYDRMRGMPPDDDINYTVAGLLLVGSKGRDFTPLHVAQFWMNNIPPLFTCTAERVAYRNFMLQIAPPASASHRNPYREWIGAQIRADPFGYLALGNPERAAEWAWRDACVSHVKNGIYGEMWVAAMIAAAPFARDIPELIRIGLSEIPKTSRLYRDISEVLANHAAGMDYDSAVGWVHARWNEKDQHDWCHTNSNAAIVALGLLYGDGDFGTSICRAVQPCFDTDCNGATVGSILGMRLGAGGIPGAWTQRLADSIQTMQMHFEKAKISAMAERTYEVYRRL